MGCNIRASSQMPEVHKIFIISRWWPGAKRPPSLSLEPFRHGYMRREEREAAGWEPPSFVCSPKAPGAPGSTQNWVHTPAHFLVWGSQRFPSSFSSCFFALCFLAWSLLAAFRGRWWIDVVAGVKGPADDQDWGVGSWPDIIIPALLKELTSMVLSE